MHELELGLELRAQHLNSPNSITIVAPGFSSFSHFAAASGLLGFFESERWSGKRWTEKGMAGLAYAILGAIVRTKSLEVLVWHKRVGGTMGKLVKRLRDSSAGDSTVPYWTGRCMLAGARARPAVRSIPNVWLGGRLAAWSRYRCRFRFRADSTRLTEVRAPSS